MDGAKHTTDTPEALDNFSIYRRGKLKRQIIRKDFLDVFCVF